MNPVVLLSIFETNGGFIASWQDDDGKHETHIPELSLFNFCACSSASVKPYDEIMSSAKDREKLIVFYLQKNHLHGAYRKTKQEIKESIMHN